MIAYKGFNKDLTCIGYKFKLDKWNEEKEAKCYKNGLHCAENPLDCLSYYSNPKKARYFAVRAEGDINEAGDDTKISCTRMLLIKELTIQDLAFHGVRFMYTHPERPVNTHVKREKAAADNYFAIVRGKNPIAKGSIGTFLYICQENKSNNKIKAIAMYEVDGKTILPDTYYDINGEVVNNDDKKRTT